MNQIRDEFQENMDDRNYCTRPVGSVMCMEENVPEKCMSRKKSIIS